MSKTHQPSAPEFRVQMVELVRAGRTPGDLSKEFGPHVSSILSWVRKAGGVNVSALSGADATLNSRERQELVTLRKEVRQLKIEREILSKATAWFAIKSEKTFTASTNS